MKSFVTIALAAVALFIAAPAVPAAAQDLEAGKRTFQACRACHLLVPGRHMTGPSLANIFGRKAGTASGFPRYSPAMRRSNIVWNALTLDKFLRDPQNFVRGNWMPFPGMEDGGDRADLIAYLQSASQAAGPVRPRNVPTLKTLKPNESVTGIRLCGDTYHVTTADGVTKLFWEFNLRFKSNGTVEGPEPGKPAILRAGMQGDRASVVFASPREISEFITIKCE